MYAHHLLWSVFTSAFLLPLWIELGDHNRSFSQILQLAAQPPPFEIACVIGLRLLHRATQLAFDPNGFLGMVKAWPIRFHRDFVFVGAGPPGISQIKHQV